MERFLRIGVITAGVALILSALVGMISGVAFGTVVIRALLAGVVFGSGGVALVLLIERILPELVQPEGRPSMAAASRSASAGSEGRDGSAPGSTLNIVVESEDGGSRSGVSGSSDDEDDEDEEDSLVEEVTEQHLDEDDDALIGDAESGETGDTEAVDRMDGGTVAGRSDAHAADRDGADGDAADDMPDIGSFAGSFVSHENGEQNGVDDMSSASDSSKSDNGNDPAEIAKALRTMMNRDQ